MSSDFEKKKKKVLYRSKYRGIRELDILFEKFTEKYHNVLDHDDLNELNELLKIPDWELLEFLMYPKNTPVNLNSKTLQRLRNLKLK
tara:strand:+ start:408 stop:668 length:261 start_codon:yes stop_codon:yes gene_type:complete